jgi:hypothetical protein
MTIHSVGHDAIPQYHYSRREHDDRKPEKCFEALIWIICYGDIINAEHYSEEQENKHQQR